MSEVQLAAEQSSPGRTLAAARAELKLSVADVSRQIKFGVKQIAAIEADDYAKLPGITFVRGMIRSYAKLVQLDPKPLLDELSRSEIPAMATVDLRESEQEPFLEGGRKSNRIYVVLSLVALLAVAVVAYEWYVGPPSTDVAATITPKVANSEAALAPSAQASALQRPGESDRPVATNMPTVGPQRDEEPGPVPGADSAPGELKRIQLEFDQMSWVQIKQANGKVLLSRLNPAGSSQSIEGAPPFHVVIGNAASVRLTYDGAPVDLRSHFKFDVARLTLE
jgi:cytoskeleton protein RodZ